MAKKASQIVADSQKKAGKKRKQVVLGPEQLELLEKLQGQYGTITAVFIAGMDALEGKNDLSQAEVLDWIRRNTG